ncbi:MAG: hypothetical protein LQ343_000108 [Gyalolechia ehrenbergii]|nr:MAG: hypothetical protein LQ343_000108 [Gyalolechia ehrenbergii]
MSLLQSSTIEPDDVEKFSDHTNGVVFMGTPFGGSDTTEWASFFERLLQVLPVGKFNKTLLEHLKKDSHQLKILGEEFPQWLNNRRHAEERKVRVMCFFEEFPVPGVGHVVTRESARIAGYEAVSLPGDHRGICKFDNFQDPKYKTVLNTLRTWVDEIKAESKSKEIVDKPNFQANTTMGKNYGGTQTGQDNSKGKHQHNANSFHFGSKDVGD